MGCFQVRYDSRVVIYERKLFIRLATGDYSIKLSGSDICRFVIMAKFWLLFSTQVGKIQ